jgi:hypothetical protein
VKRPFGSVQLNAVKRPFGSVQLNAVKRPGRRRLLLGAVAGVIAVVVASLVAGQLRDRPPSDCDIVRDLLAYNRQFTEQTKTSAETGNPELSTIEQYRGWAARLKDDAARIQDPALSARAESAATLAAATTDLVPKYRAKPDDAEIRRQYARIGIEFGNAITSLDYSCANPRS